MRTYGQSHPDEATGTGPYKRASPIIVSWFRLSLSKYGLIRQRHLQTYPTNLALTPRTHKRSAVRRGHVLRQEDTSVSTSALTGPGASNRSRWQLDASGGSEPVTHPSMGGNKAEVTCTRLFRG